MTARERLLDELRPACFAIAYRMLGSVSEAEDVVQEALLRVHQALQAGERIASPRAFAATVTTRLAINELRSARATSATGCKSQDNVRQLATRARRHVEQRRPRFETTREQRDELAQRFFAAAEQGDLAGLEALLAHDVVLTGDGGGKAPAIARSLRGRDRVARTLINWVRLAARLPGVSLRPVEVNGSPGALFLDAQQRLFAVCALDIAGGQITSIGAIVNPDKLAHLGPVTNFGSLLEAGEMRPGLRIGPRRSQMSTAQPTDDKATFSRFHDAMNSGDAELISKAIDQFVDPDLLFHAPVPSGATGVQALKQVWAVLLRAFPDLHVTVEDVIAEGDKVVGRNTVTGTHRGEYMGLPPTGKSVTYNEIFIFRFAGGRIAEIWGVVDVLSQLRQLGAIPGGPS